MRVWIETMHLPHDTGTYFVTLRVRVWIETFERSASKLLHPVTLRVRVWIETQKINYHVFVYKVSPSA